MYRIVAPSPWDGHDKARQKALNCVVLRQGVLILVLEESSNFSKIYTKKHVKLFLSKNEIIYAE